jgi:hypothetical protein
MAVAETGDPMRRQLQGDACRIVQSLHAALKHYVCKLRQVNSDNCMKACATARYLIKRSKSAENLAAIAQIQHHIFVQVLKK